MIIHLISVLEHQYGDYNTVWSHRNTVNLMFHSRTQNVLKILSPSWLAVSLFITNPPMACVAVLTFTAHQ